MPEPDAQVKQLINAMREVDGDVEVTCRVCGIDEFGATIVSCSVVDAICCDCCQDERAGFQCATQDEKCPRSGNSND